MAETRYVTIPHNIMVELETGEVDDNGKPKLRRHVVPFLDFLKTRTRDAAFGADLDCVLMALAIRQHFGGTAPESVIGLQLDQWEKLCETVRKPSDGYNPEVMAQLLPYARAILDAPSTDPRPQLAEDKAG